MELKTGDILHCRNKGLQSFVVGLCTKSNITHTAVVIWNWYSPCIIEAEPGRGINIKNYENWVKINGENYEISRMDGLDEKEISTKLMSKSGITSYPLIKMLFIYIIHFIFGKWIKIEEDKMWCSAFAAWFRGYEDWHTITPIDLYNKEKENKQIIFL